MLYEYYAFIHAIGVMGNEDIHYQVKLFPISKKSLPIDPSSLTFDSMDPAFRHGHFRATIAHIGDLVRDILELRAAHLALDGLTSGDALIRDGTLQATHHLQEQHFNELFTDATAKGVIVAAIAKTCTLFCKSGKSLLGTLAQLADAQPIPSWYYAPLVEIKNEKHSASMIIAKFHPRSSHIFRCEIHQNQTVSLGSLLSQVARNSKDPIFLGYPYGLIEADQFARVSEKEGAYLATRFIAQCKAEWSHILPFINASNAHAILDNK